MDNLNDAITRIVNYYNVINPDIGVQAVYGRNIISDNQSNIYQNTAANFITNLEYTGTAQRKVVTNDDPPPTKYTIVRYEPILTIRTVFTGKDALVNASMHYQRMRQMLSAYTDQSLIAAAPFKEASIVFDQNRYLVRYQSDARYLAFLDVPFDETYIDSIEEYLKAYQDGTFTELLTSRTINIP